MPLSQEKSDGYANEWETQMLTAPCTSPLKCCFGCLCFPCALYTQREKLIGDNPYICCAGLNPCCCFQDSECPKVPCLCIEVCCCAALAVSANRILVQERAQIQNDPCDTCIICCTNCVLLARCCLGCFGYDLPDVVDNAIDCLYFSVLGCMYTQTAVEIDKRGDGVAGTHFPPKI